MQKKLVEPVSPDRVERGSVRFNYEPAFVVPTLSGLTNLRDMQGKNAAYLSHCVSRHPQDLKSHVQRVNLYLQAPSADGVWGALVDLFSVLQTNGKALKQRLLDTARGTLGDRRHLYLQSWLENGLSIEGACPTSIHSVLSGGAIESLRLVSRSEAHSGQERNPLTEALERLEYGQVSEAQAVLEAAIQKDSSRVELHHELLSIYRGTRDTEAFVSMHDSLVPGENPVSEAWIELARHFAESN